MNISEKPKYAKVFKDEMGEAEFQSIGMTPEEVMKLRIEADTFIEK